MKKKDPRKTHPKKSEELTDKALEEHIEKLVAKTKELPKKTIEEKVKKTKKEQVQEKKIKEKDKTIEIEYGKQEYARIRTIHQQVMIDPYKGFAYKSNVKTNEEFYSHLTSTIKTPDKQGENHIVSSENMDSYAHKTMLNFVIGEALMGIGSMNPVTVEEKEKMAFSLYDPTQKAMYFAKIALTGWGYQVIGTTLKTMHGISAGSKEK